MQAATRSDMENNSQAGRCWWLEWDIEIELQEAPGVQEVQEDLLPYS